MTKSSSVGPPRDIGGGRWEYMVSGNRFVVSKRYSVQKAVGYGAYGLVCAAVDTETGEKVAIKKITKVFDDLVDGKRILREIRLLSFLNHENVISIKDLLRPSDRDTFQDIYFVSELMDTDLHHIIRSKQKLTNEHCQYFIYQALRALKYIHSANIMHRDLKPGNLLVNGNCDLLICDFGLARGYVKDALTDYVVTRWYRPPELLLHSNHYSAAVDIWSIGCIFAELMMRSPLFPGRDYINQLRLIIDVLGTPTEEDLNGMMVTKETIDYLRNMKRKTVRPLSSIIPGASNLALDFLEKMLAFSPAKRLTAAEALAHPYLSLLHDPNDEPTCPSKFFMEKDSEDFTAEELRRGLWEEIEKFHPHPHSGPEPPIDIVRQPDVTRVPPRSLYP